MSVELEGSKQAEPSAFRLVGTLGLAGLVSGFAIVGIYVATLPKITANKKAALQHAIFEVVPGAAHTQALRLSDDGRMVPDPEEEAPAVYAAYDESGAFAGYAIPAKGPGFQDTIALIFGYRPAEHAITGLRVLESRETPGLGDKIVKDQAFVEQWGKLRFDPSAAPPVLELVKGKASNPHQVEAITGATISSRSVTKIVNKALAERTPQLPEPGSEPPLAGGGGEQR